VLKEFYSGYERGETPNPDVLCNEFIKFGLFLKAARKLKMDYVATGHYARIRLDRAGAAHLLRGIDKDKDQSYFLHRVSQDALRQTLFPVGDLEKKEVRAMAKKIGLSVATKADSQGICFIGKLDVSDFLSKKIKSVPGDIIGPDGEVLGKHQGLFKYTIGQRQGILVHKGGSSWFVAKKDLKKNQLVIVPSSNHPLLNRKDATVFDLHWTLGKAPKLPVRISCQVRYRQSPVNAVLRKGKSKGSVEVNFVKPVKAIASGQSAVFYMGQECIGGGVLS
jgi:tRNA-specific 2-thiouridylase